MPGVLPTLAQHTTEPVSQIRDGFGLLIILVGIGLALIVIALGLTMANRRTHGPRKKRRHPGPIVDPWKEAGARARTPTAWELEKSNRPRPRKPRPFDSDPPAEGPSAESGGPSDPDVSGTDPRDKS